MGKPTKPLGLSLIEICGKHIAIEQSKTTEKEHSKENAYNAVNLVYDEEAKEVEVKEKKSKKKRKLEETSIDNGDEPLRKSKKESEKETTATSVAAILMKTPVTGDDSINVGIFERDVQELSESDKVKKKKKKRKSDTSEKGNEINESDLKATEEKQTWESEDTTINTDVLCVEVENEDKSKKKKKKKKSISNETEVPEEPRADGTKTDGSKADD